MRWYYTGSVLFLVYGLVWTAWWGWQWRQGMIEAERLVELQAGRGGDPGKDAEPRLRLAWANHLVGRRRYDEALGVFSDLVNSSPASLQSWVHYNLGNLYLRRAREQVEQSAFDDAMPLVALAKQAYRQALRLNPDLWAARYNLEAAIRLLPEIERFEMERKEGKKTDQEALWTRVPGFPRGLP